MIIIVVIASVTVIVIAIAVARRRATATHDDDVVVVLLSASGNKGVYDAQPIPHGVGWSGDACHVIRDRHKIKNPGRASHWRYLICPSLPTDRPTQLASYFPNRRLGRWSNTFDISHSYRTNTLFAHAGPSEKGLRQPIRVLTRMRPMLLLLVILIWRFLSHSFIHACMHSSFLSVFLFCLSFFFPTSFNTHCVT